MKKFLLNILLFLVLLAAGVIVLFLIPVDRKYAYDFISEGGCKGRTPWIYYRIFVDSASIDIAFIGSSHTMCSVNDTWIQKTILDSTGKNISCCNLALCGYGRDYDYVVIKDLLEHKKVKTIVLEVRQTEAQLGHLYFPYVASVNDLFTAPKYFNRSYLPAIYKAFIFRLQYVRELFTHEDAKRTTDASSSLFGFNGTGDIANEDELKKFVTKEKAKEKKKIAAVENILDIFPTYYANEIAALAKAKHTKLVFLYLPSYTGEAPKKEIEDRYSALGKIIFPDEKILQDKANWAEHEHLNLHGAEKISQSLVSVIDSL